MDMDFVSLENALVALGQLLEDRGQYYEVVAVGGGGLLLLKFLTRTTKDLDLVALMKDGQLVSANPLPKMLLQAAEDVGNALQLGRNWLNFGPSSLMKMGLPIGFKERMETYHFKGLTVHLAGRFDQICFKLYATVDHGPRSKHFLDLVSLKPSFHELEKAKNWCITHDVSESFELEINKAMESINASI